MKRRAFTLVELLVVIAIISILAGMLMPALERAIYSARTISCANNYKQLSLGYKMYGEDHDSVMPACVNRYRNYSDLAWRFMLRPYIEQVEILQDSKLTLACPEAIALHGEASRGFSMAQVDIPLMMTRSWMLTRIAAPSTTIQNTEARYYTSDRYDWLIGVTWNFITYLIPEARHNDQMGVNLLYVDGHVEYSESNADPADYNNVYGWPCVPKNYWYCVDARVR